IAGAAHGDAAAGPGGPTVAVRRGRCAGRGALSRPPGERPGRARAARPASPPELAPRTPRSARQASGVIARITGTLVEKHVQRLIVDVRGVGYEVLVPLSTMYAVGDAGTEVTLRIHTHVREDALQLFGFLTPLEQTLFERLITVSGIGPKLALSVLSGIETNDLVQAIRSGDVARLTRTPGVGRKTAERIVVDLKDRLEDAAVGATDEVTPGGSVRDDLLSALQNLGYQRNAVEKKVDKVLQDEATAEFEAALRAVLRELSRA